MALVPKESPDFNDSQLQDALEAFDDSLDQLEKSLDVLESLMASKDFNQPPTQA
jgi:hypothetical protein